MTHDEQKAIRETLTNVQHILWGIHYKLDGNEDKESKRVDARIGTIIGKLEDIKWMYL